MYLDLADFLRDVRIAAQTKITPERLLASAPTTSGNESTGADGGYAVVPDLAKACIIAIRETSVIGRLNIIPAKGNNISLPIDEVAPWTAAPGVYWEKELAALDQYKPAFQARNMRLFKLTCFIPVSDEVLEDGDLFDAWVRTSIPARLGARLQTSVIRGDGVGKPAGILGANATISVPRLLANAVSAADFRNMWNRLYGAGRDNAVWLTNADVDIPTTPGLPLLLHGARVHAVEAASTLGTRGDVILADLSQFVLLLKNLRIDTSIHVFFDVAATAYRFLLRVAGQPNWSKAYAGENSSTTRSPFVVLTDAA